MLNLHYSIDRVLKIGFKITLESHHIKYANSKLIIKPSYPEFGSELRFF